MYASRPIGYNVVSYTNSAVLLNESAVPIWYLNSTPCIGPILPYHRGSVGLDPPDAVVNVDLRGHTLRTRRRKEGNSPYETYSPHSLQFVARIKGRNDLCYTRHGMCTRNASSYVNSYIYYNSYTQGSSDYSPYTQGSVAYGTCKTDGRGANTQGSSDYSPYTQGSSDYSSCTYGSVVQDRLGEPDVNGRITYTRRRRRVPPKEVVTLR